MKNKKLTAGVFSFTACYGCQLQIIKMEELTEVLKAIDFAEFELVSDKKQEGPLDVAFVEGGISREEQIPILQKIRARSDFLVAIGACACDAGIPGIKSFMNEADAERIVYGEEFRKHLRSVSPRPIDKYVKVDYYMNGCPIERFEFHKLAKELAIGRKPREKRHAVCLECKIKENRCLLDYGMPCMGPVTNGGCFALCPSNNAACEGCRGPVQDANLPAFAALMEETGVEKKRVKQMLQRFGGRTALVEDFVEKMRD